MLLIVVAAPRNVNCVYNSFKTPQLVPKMVFENYQ